MSFGEARAERGHFRLHCANPSQQPHAKTPANIGDFQHPIMGEIVFLGISGEGECAGSQLSVLLSHRSSYVRLFAGFESRLGIQSGLAFG